MYIRSKAVLISFIVAYQISAGTTAEHTNGVLPVQPPIMNISVTPSIEPPRRINVVVYLAIAVIHESRPDGRPTIRMLTTHDRRIPVPLDHVRSFAGVERCLRNLLLQTLSQYGLTPTRFTKCAAAVSPIRHPVNNGLIGITDNEVTWEDYINTVANMYHKPCETPGYCAICSEPAYVSACFPERCWTSVPLTTGVTISDDYFEEHAQTLGQLSLSKMRQYIDIVGGNFRTMSSGNVNDVNLNSMETQASESQNTTQAVNTSNLEPRATPNASRRSSTNKPVDYSKGTLFPATASEGLKAVSDTCLTCLRYHRSCKGTTMAFIKAARSDRSAQWKCESCQCPQRRCLWRPSLAEITTYEEAFEADGGVNVPVNTVQGRLERGIVRRSGKKEESENADGPLGRVQLDGRLENKEEDGTLTIKEGDVEQGE